MTKYGRNYGSDNSGCGSVVFLLLIAVVIIVVSFASVLHETEYTNLTVKDKSYSGKNDGYIVWFEDENGTQYEFENEDSLFKWKWDSSKIQGQLEEGATYNITTTGWRAPIFSLYPNIVEYELVESVDNDKK